MKGKFDVEDAVMGPVFAISTAATVGIADVSLFGASLTDTLFTIGQEAIPVGSAIAIGVFILAYVTNDADITRLDDEYTYAVLGTVALLLLVPTIPSLLDFVKSSDFFALAVVAVQAGGYAGVSYLA